MAEKLVITKSLLDDLAQSINAKSGSTGAKTIAQMQATVEGIGTGSTPETVSWHQCPEGPRRFVAEVTYDPADYSVSHIAEYATESYVEANYKPIGKAIGDKTFYNQVPNAWTDFVAGEVFGRLKPLDPVRYLNTPSAPNVRDLGGWACDGGTIKYGLLFRGGELAAEDRAVLVDECGVRHDLDLRGDVSLTQSPLGADIHYQRTAQNIYYHAQVNDTWKSNIRCIFNAISHNEPVYFHCTAGADRTGTLACVLEGLLGVSQSDIDKDYELTCFFFGTATDSLARRRNESEWQGLITEINAYDGDTFRDKCTTFVAKLGFTADEINAFRAAMIDGTPETVSPSIANCTITRTLAEGVSSGNDAGSIAQYQPYTAEIKAEAGKLISGVTVKMGGVEITGAAWSGDGAKLARAVTYTLNNCNSSNKRGYVLEGQSFAAKISPRSGYTLDGAAVKITMGGADMADYYSGGVIAIPNVTGDIEITVDAVSTAPQYTNLLSTLINNDGNVLDGVGYRANKRWSSSSTTIDTASDMDGSYLFGLLPAQDGDTIRIKAPGKTAFNGPYDQIKWFYNDRTAISGYTNYNNMENNGVSASIDADTGVVTFNLNSPSTGKGAYAYISIVLQGITDISGVVITKNEEIV